MLREQLLALLLGIVNVDYRYDIFMNLVLDHCKELIPG